MGEGFSISVSKLRCASDRVGSSADGICGRCAAAGFLAGLVPGRARRATGLLLICLGFFLLPGCSVRQYTVNMIGDSLAEGGSVYERDDDIVLVGEALPFSIKMLEMLIAESPRNQGLLLAAARAYVLYSYAYVQHLAEIESQDDIRAARVHRDRARRLYLRAQGYALRAMEVSWPGIGARLRDDPVSAVEGIGGKDVQQEVAMLYWTAASLGLAISVSKHDPAMLARLPEVEALLGRAMELDEDWDAGTLHEFAVIWAGARPGVTGPVVVREHFERALALSGGHRSSVFVSYAEAVSVPAQDRTEFVDLLERALAVDPEKDPDHRLVNAISQRRAQWLLERTDELILE